MMNVNPRTIFTGDNLPVLRGIEAESVDMVYADPPFSKGREFAAPIGSKAAGAMFRDAWTLSDVDVAWSGEIRAMNPALSAIVEAAGLSAGSGMQSYLTMMAIRIIEIRRILHERGAFFLHCDSTAAAYLKVLCDSIFGYKRFRNEIIWKRNSSHNDARAFGRVTDTILFYGGSDIRADAMRVPLDAEYVKRKYRYEDSRGLYREDNLTAKGLSGGGYEYEFHGHDGPWQYPQARMLELEQEGRIHFPKKIDGVPALKRYLDGNKGQIPSNLWIDIPPINSRAKERTGYPTQKPLALLRRFIEAATKPGDLILDPFASCATSLVAAEELGRQWIGIDVSPVAVRLVKERMKDELGLFGLNIIERSDIPRRKGKRSRNIRELLYGK